MVTAHSGGLGVVCLPASAEGREYRLHAERPATVERLTRAALSPRAEILDSDGIASGFTSPDGIGEPAVMRVDIRGPIEQRAGFHDPCAGWTDGWDAITERMVAALEMGDVLLVSDCPGGAVSGLQEAVRRIQEEKAEHGRRITGWVDELCASAAMWLLAAVCDEIFLPVAGQMGSIGARGMHVSVAGALAEEGVVPTIAVWPGPGKAALAPELPLSETGRMRMDRDVAIAGEAFAAAMVAARKGLTREAIVELDADCLTGKAAVAARLADDVSTYEEVLAMALAEAGSTGDTAMKIHGESESQGSESTAARAGDPPPKPGENDGKPPGNEPDSACKACGSANEMNAKFCDQCGASMAAKPMADDDAAAPPADPPPAAPAKPGAPPPPKPPAPDSRSASMALAAGLRADASVPATRVAVLANTAFVAAVLKMTGATSRDEALGTLRASLEKATSADDMAAELSAAKKREDWTERMALVKRLADADLPGYPRGELLVTRVVTEGEAPTVAPAKMYAEMNLGTLRGFVNGKLSGRALDAPAAKRNPFQPPPAPKETAPGSATVTDADRATATKFGLDPERVAASRHAIQMQNVTPPHATHGA